MKVEQFSPGLGGCSGGTCPTVYRTDRGTFIVQGSALDAVASQRVSPPDGEQAVEVPAELLIGIAEKLAALRMNG